jgi:murein L,D-transpeptidase YcbB/YkuD
MRLRDAAFRAVLLLALVACAACRGKSIEEREREAAEEIERSMVDVEAAALAQDVDTETVKEAQKYLTALHEYQGKIDGKLDSVTVNAIQAFQRAQGMDDDGILDARTRRRLAEAASHAEG